jgi:hypothetical protein
MSTGLSSLLKQSCADPVSVSHRPAVRRTRSGPSCEGESRARTAEPRTTA